MPVANQRIGEFILEERIGAGAFGEVWRARHHVWADQLVAVKFPTDSEYIRQLQREGITIHALKHENIVQALNFDPFADPPYLVMEYVPGTSLRKVIDQGAMRIEDAVSVMKQVLAGLTHAHSQGVIHRDLKPENVLIHEDAFRLGFDTPAIAKLADFGLGTANQSATSIVISRSTAGPELAGTPLYIAPEVIEGAEPDDRADLFSCGVILFEMLTGRRPAGPELPSEVNPAAPRYLDEAYRSACSRVERRYGSAQEMAEGIEYRPTAIKPPPLPPMALVAPAEAVPPPVLVTAPHYPSEPARPIAMPPMPPLPPEPAIPSNAPLPSTVWTLPSDGSSPRGFLRRFWPVLVIVAIVLAVTVRRASERSVVSRQSAQWRSQSIPLRNRLPQGDNKPTVIEPRRPVVPDRRSDPQRTMTNSVGMTLIYIAGGEFVMGSPDWEANRKPDEVAHRVRLRGFHIGSTEVTQKQWVAVMRTNPSSTKSENLPVDSVSWDDAQDFCRRLSAREGHTYRLPTEAQWEYACRAGSVAAFPGPSELYAWSKENAGGRAQIIATRKPNAWGIYDMHGNVWEWCADYYGPYNAAFTPADPTGPAQGTMRVLRGGSWLNVRDNCRAAIRHKELPIKTFTDVGFRVVMEP